MRDGSGAELIVYADPDRLQAHLRELSPGDAVLSDALCEGVRCFRTFDMSLLARQPKSLLGLTGWASLGRTMLPYLPALARWGTISARELAARYKDPFLRRAVAEMFSWPDIPVMAGLSLLAYMANGNAGVPRRVPARAKCGVQSVRLRHRRSKMPARLARRPASLCPAQGAGHLSWLTARPVPFGLLDLRTKG